MSSWYVLLHLPRSSSLSCSSLAMIKGATLSILLSANPEIIYSVMSGIITGPYFRAYFKQPSSVQIGNMVAILEVGAFGQSWNTPSFMTL